MAFEITILEEGTGEKLDLTSREGDVVLQSIRLVD
jgi:hypothetical protein